MTSPVKLQRHAWIPRLLPQEVAILLFQYCDTSLLAPLIRGLSIRFDFLPRGHSLYCTHGVSLQKNIVFILASRPINTIKTFIVNAGCSALHACFNFPRISTVGNSCLWITTCVVGICIVSRTILELSLVRTLLVVLRRDSPLFFVWVLVCWSEWVFTFSFSSFTIHTPVLSLRAREGGIA